MKFNKIALLSLIALNAPSLWCAATASTVAANNTSESEDEAADAAYLAQEQKKGGDEAADAAYLAQEEKKAALII